MCACSDPYRTVGLLLRLAKRKIRTTFPEVVRPYFEDLVFAAALFCHRADCAPRLQVRRRDGG